MEEVIVAAIRLIHYYKPYDIRFKHQCFGRARVDWIREQPLLEGKATGLLKQSSYGDGFSATSSDP